MALLAHEQHGQQLIAAVAGEWLDAQLGAQLAGGLHQRGVRKGDKVLIQYFPVRGRDGQYLGVMEITRNIKRLQEIKGEKLLLDEVKTR